MSSTPSPSLAGRVVLVVGTGGIARAIAAAARDAGATVHVGARDAAKGEALAAELGAHAVRIDLADEASIAATLDAVGRVDHVVSTANAAATGPVGALDAGAIGAAVAAKLTGPVLLAKHAAGRLPADGSLTFFAGVVAWRPSSGSSVMAMTNGGLAHLGAALAVELAPVRVNVVSPGIVDSGQWDRLGDERDAFFARTAERLPARRVGRPEDVAGVALTAMTNPFVTGSVLHVDGGGRWA